MSRPVIVYYDNVDIFDNVKCPTPFVTRSNSVINYGNKFGQTSDITLDGVITGHNFTGTYGLYQKSLNLSSGFSKNFKNLKIVDTSDGTQTIFENVVKVNSIDFQEDTFARLINYSIGLEAYETGLFKNTIGVLDPEDEVSISRGENGEISIDRTVSAVGFNVGNSSSDALSRAITFVRDRTGLSSIANYSLLSFVSGSGDGSSLILTSQSENIDRFAGSYSVNESYIYQELSGADSDFYSSLASPVYKTATFNYSPSSQESPLEESSFSISWRTNKNTGDFAFLRKTVAKYINKLKASNGVASIEDSIVQEAVNNFGLDGSVFYSISENEQEATIDIDLQISNSPYFDSDYGVYFTETASVSKDEISDISDINYSFTVEPFGLALQRDASSVSYDYVSSANDLMKRSYDYYSGLISGGLENFVSGKVIEIVSGIYSTGYDKIKVTSLNKDDDQNNGTISVGSSSTNRETFASGEIRNANYNYNCSVPQRVTQATKSSLTNDHIVLNQYSDLYTRQLFGVSINGGLNLSGKLSSSDIGSAVRSKASEFIELGVDQMTGEKGNIDSESFSINQNAGTFSMSKAVSSKHTDDGYKLKFGPYLS
tara:strand:- start:714 stop:2516 length:1803 start_codon:yes stop_codon:yes gene_type:complete